MSLNKKTLKAMGSILFVLFAAAYAWLDNQVDVQQTSLVQNSEIYGFYQDKISGRMVLTAGHVHKVLADDNKGSRHQRFIIELDNDMTVLVAHNIDLAPRVPLYVGDEVEIYGQYEWNQKGGVLHWTHHDPRKQHAEGWIKHKDQIYQ